MARIMDPHEISPLFRASFPELVFEGLREDCCEQGDKYAHYQGCPRCTSTCLVCGQQVFWQASWGINWYDLHEECYSPTWLLDLLEIKH